MKFVHDFQSCIFQVDLCRFGICFNCITFAQLSKVENSDVIYVLQSGEAISYQQQTKELANICCVIMSTNWRVGKHMLCHLAVKQYINLFEIFVTKSLDESFFQVIQLCARSSSKAHTRSWLPKRPSGLKGDLSKHSPIKNYQSSLPGRYVPSIGSSARSSDDATGPYLTNCKAAMVQRQLCETDILDYQVSDREEKEQKARVVAIAALLWKRKKRMHFGVAPAPQRSGCLIECAARLHCWVLMASLATFSIDYLWIWQKHSFLSWRQEVVFLLNLSKAHLGFEVFLLAQRSQFQWQFSKDLGTSKRISPSLISPHYSPFAPGSASEGFTRIIWCQ